MNDKYKSPLCGPQITVRRARIDEAERIHRIVTLSMQSYCRNSNIPREKLEATSETVDDVRKAILSVPFFVAVKADGTIVGSVRLITRTAGSFGFPQLPFLLSAAPDTKVTYFSRFAVQEDMQGLGIGSLLYEAAEKSAAESKSPYMLLHTSLVNSVMVSFYEKRGFALLFEDPSRGYPRGLFGKKLPQPDIKTK